MNVFRVFNVKNLLVALMLLGLCLSQAAQGARHLHGNHGIPTASNLHKFGQALKDAGKFETAVGAGATVVGAVTNNKDLENGGLKVAGAGLATEGTGYEIKQHTKGPKDHVLYGRRSLMFGTGATGAGPIHFGRKLLKSGNKWSLPNVKVVKRGKKLNKAGKALTVAGTATAAYGAVTNNKQLEDAGVAVATTGVAAAGTGKVIENNSKPKIVVHSHSG